MSPPSYIKATCRRFPKRGHVRALQSPMPVRIRSDGFLSPWGIRVKLSNVVLFLVEIEAFAFVVTAIFS